MSSLPFSVLSTQMDDILPLISIQEHQKFCKSFLKSYQSYKKRVSDEKTDINKHQSEDDFVQTQKKQNQEEILKWFENLTIYQRIKICTIKNKWLVNLLIQLYLVYKTYDTCYLKPIIEMADLFQAQKNFSHGNEDSQFNSINNILSHQNYPKNTFFQNDLNFYENFFCLEYPNNNYKMFNIKENEKREKEKKFLYNIKLLSLEENTNTIDTLTLNKDFLMNFKEIKEILKFFSNDKCFHDWLLPIKVNNIYNFVLPQWMHNNKNLTLFQIIIGYIEQQILLNYEYFYYSKKIYEYSYSNLIVDLYEENKKLVTFVKDNYSFHNHNDDINKKEFISLMEIREIVRNIKKSKNYENKIAYLQQIYNYVYNNEFNSDNRNCILNIDFDKQIYEDLYKESMSGGESGIMKVLEHITFMEFKDIVNARHNLFSSLRKRIVDSYYEKIMNELMSDNFVSGNSNTNKKKNKNKKKKKKNKNNENNTQNKEDKKEKKENKNTSEEDIKDSKNNTENINNTKDNTIMINNKEENIKEIKEFNIYDDYIENKKNIENNIYDNKNIIEEDIKIINVEKNKNILINNEKNDSIHLIDINNQNNEKEITLNNYSDLKEDQKEPVKIEENKNTIKKNKNKKDFFLYPTNNNVKKIKKKKNLHSLSAKKTIENNIKNPLEKNISKNNSPSPKINKENDKNIYKFNITNINMKIEPKIQEKNFYETKSSSPFTTQHQSFSFYKNNDNTSKNEDISINSKIKIENITNITNITNISNNNITNIENDDNSTNINNDNNISNDNNNINNYTDNNFKINYSNIPIISNSFSSYTPSEKFFESLTKEISNYIDVTIKNITNLNPIHLKYLTQVEKLIKTGLESKYDIKFGHYGSHFTNLSIEGSDLDILINYKSKNNENNNDFFKDILSVLNQNEEQFDLIKPIFTASVPVIKLQINIKNEIKDVKLKHMAYFEDDNELTKMNIDLTFTQNEQEYQHSHQIVSYINQSLISFPIIKSLLLILKRYFKIMKMNKSFHGGLSSYSLYLLIYTFCKKFPISISSSGKALYSFLGFFSFFEFHKYGVDVENINIYYLTNNYISNNYNYNFEEQIMKKEINIIDPLTKLNVAKSSFKVEEIQGTFRSAYDFLIKEGCYYDYAVFVNKTGFENDIFNHIKTNFDKDINSDFKTIKKLFALNKKHYFFDLYAN